VRFYADVIENIAVKLGQIRDRDNGGRRTSLPQALDASAMPIRVRDVKRRGHGWLAGQADIGWSNSLWVGRRGSRF
jgi:hypothetical protein